MRVEVHLYSQSQPIEIERAFNAYTKDGLYCVMVRDGVEVHKFPVQHIFRIKELADEVCDEPFDNIKHK